MVSLVSDSAACTAAPDRGRAARVAGGRTAPAIGLAPFSQPGAAARQAARRPTVEDRQRAGARRPTLPHQ